MSQDNNTQEISKYRHVDQDISTSGNIDMSARPPVVVILGHVDHGKTTVLDYIRKTKIADKEAGGITQHIGAYQVELPKAAKSAAGAQEFDRVTFLDTPGHEAFSAIRSRGAKVADVGVLIVAAEEGVKPQTKEAIAILQETKLPYVVAINKIDKPEANPQRIRQELAENNVFVEGYGGQTPVVEISGRTGQGIDSLLETILLLAEVEELKGDISLPAEGVIIESHLDNKRGSMATLLIRNGTLRVGDYVVAGAAVSPVRSMEDFLAKRMEEAGPATPVVVSGWSITPDVGSTFTIAKNKNEAEAQAQKALELGPKDLFLREEGAETENKKVLNIIIKADVMSSLEALDHVLKTIKSEEVGYKVVSYGVGNISVGDIKNAIPTKSIIIGFHVLADSGAKQIAEREHIEIMTFDIIYELVEAIRGRIESMLEPETKKTSIGKLKVLAIFKKDERSQIVGGKVVSGKLKRGGLIELVRGGKSLMTGVLGQLQQNKQDTAEVNEGVECGIRFDYPKKHDAPMLPIREGDVLEVYEEEKVLRTL